MPAGGLTPWLRDKAGLTSVALVALDVRLHDAWVGRVEAGPSGLVTP